MGALDGGSVGVIGDEADLVELDGRLEVGVDWDAGGVGEVGDDGDEQVLGSGGDLAAEGVGDVDAADGGVAVVDEAVVKASAAGARVAVAVLAEAAALPEEEPAVTWAERNDARNYAVLGDPAVRLRVDALEKGVPG